MKIILLLITSLTIAGNTSLFSQWTDIQNNNINFHFYQDVVWYGGGNDGDGQADPTIRTDLYIEGEGWTGEECTTWDCSGPCTFESSDLNWYGTNYPFDTEWSVWIKAFESDGSNDCIYDSSVDDYYYTGYGVLRDNQTVQKIVYPSTDFYPCAFNYWLAGNGSPWLFQNSPNFDQIMSMRWRYYYGDNSGERLSFGTISNGQTKIDYNSNRGSENGSLTDYSNTAEYSSPDVWYHFVLDQPSSVTISTDHGETDFDTVLRLYHNDNSFITSDDDGGSNNTSVITRQLCAGAYTIMVEGFSANEGVFKLSVSVSALNSPSVIDISSQAASCPDVNDGSASINVSGGVSPYTTSWTWNGGTASNVYSVSGLPVGNVTVNVSDACGQNASSGNIYIASADNVPPVADCANQLVLQIPEGSSETISVADINDGSYDNCGIEDFQLSQYQFDSSDEGWNNVTLTLTDENGNSSSCVTQVLVDIITDISENQMLELFKIYPNPNNGIFTIDLEQLQPGANSRIDILDVSGRIIDQLFPVVPLFNVSLNIENGVYFFRLNDNGKTLTKTVCIE